MPGDLQQVRRIDGAAGDDDLARRERLVVGAFLSISDAGATAAFEQQPRRDSLGLDPQIWAPPRFGQEGPRRRAAKAAVTGHLRIADTLLNRAVVVAGQREACLPRRFDKAMCQRQDGPVIFDEQRAALAAVLGITRHITFGFFEKGQDIGIAPAAAAHLRPAVIIGRIAAHIEHAVDRAGAAQHPAARPVQ